VLLRVHSVDCSRGCAYARAPMPAVLDLLNSALRRVLAAGAEVDWAGQLEGVAPTNVLAVTLRDPASAAAMFIALNPYPREVAVSLPLAGPVGVVWRRVCDTALLPPEDFDPSGPLLPEGAAFYTLQAHAGLLLIAAST
jgi:hypothetical protein